MGNGHYTKNMCTQPIYLKFKDIILANLICSNYELTNNSPFTKDILCVSFN